MKNSEEFRRTVYEKAAHYEAKRKARNRKIMETVSLCSLCLVIGISAYFARSAFDGMTSDGVDISTVESDTCTMASTIAPAETEATTSSTYAHITETSTAATVATTSTAAPTDDSASVTTTAAATLSPTTTSRPEYTATSTVTVETTDATVEYIETSVIETPPTETVEPNTSPCTPTLVDFFFGEGADETFEMKVYTTADDFKQALETTYEAYLPESEYMLLKNHSFSEPFFHENVLIVLYIPDTYEITYTITDGDIVFSAELAPSDDKNGTQMLYLYSCKSTFYNSAKLIVSD